MQHRVSGLYIFTTELRINNEKTRILGPTESCVFAPVLPNQTSAINASCMSWCINFGLFDSIVKIVMSHHVQLLGAATTYGLVAGIATNNLV